MPGRTPDVGIKRFEIRTGVAGLPTLGGMFRAGDPATIPPHKFHLLVNMRRTPAGMITRPGLTLEFDTGVRECINGLTEDAGEQGGAVMLYPGASFRAGNGTSAFNAATFRAVFPDSSTSYSEYVFTLYGLAATQRGNTSPVAWYPNAPGPTILSRPFLFRGQAVQFFLVDRNGTPTVALGGLNLPQRSFLQAADCWRDSARPNDGTSPSCPGAAGQPTPVDPQEPPLWPYQHPIGTIGILTYFDNPFPTDAPWSPDASIGASGLFLSNPFRIVDLILSRQERIDDPLALTAGVSEVLYFVAMRFNGFVLERRLVRWDGVQQTNEFTAIPDDSDRPALVNGTYGPVLISQGTNGDANDWAARRKDDGTWEVIGGIGTVFGAAVGDYLNNANHGFLERGVAWGGKTHGITFGEYQCALASAGSFIHAHPEGAMEFDAALATRSCTPLHDCADANPLVAIDAALAGSFLYVIAYNAAGDVFLCVGDFLDPLVPVTPRVRLTTASLSLPNDVPPTGVPTMWVQAVGSRVYVGGKFNHDPSLGAADAAHHGVYDVTNPTGIFMTYRVYETEQPEDAGDWGDGPKVFERYSYGALPAVPNDDTGGQGFQPS